MPCAVETANYTRLSAYYSIVSMFDRKIQRDPFIEGASDAIKLIESLRFAEVLSLLHQDLVNPEKEREKIAEDVTTLIMKNLEAGESYRISLQRHMNLVSQCPYEGDTNSLRIRWLGLRLHLTERLTLGEGMRGWEFTWQYLLTAPQSFRWMGPRSVTWYRWAQSCCRGLLFFPACLG